MSHQAKAIVLVCIDFRFQKEIRNFLTEKGLDGEYDLIALAGSAKNLANPSTPIYKDIILSQIQLSQNLHQITEVFLINHQDCGAYGAELAKDPIQEFEVHKKDLLESKKIIEAVAPLKVRLFYVNLNKEFQEISE